MKKNQPIHPLEDPKLWAKVGSCQVCKCPDNMMVNNTFVENTYSISCNNCGYRSEECDTFEKAIDAWNLPKEGDKK